MVFYDLGLLNEVIGEFDKAEGFYKKAIGIKDDEVYIQALASVKKAREERKRLEEQGNGRDK